MDVGTRVLAPEKAASVEVKESVFLASTALAWTAEAVIMSDIVHNTDR